MNVTIGHGRPTNLTIEVQTQSGYSEGADCWINWGARGTIDAAGTFAQPRCKPGSSSAMVMAGAVPTSPDWANFEIEMMPLTPGEHRDVRAMAGRGGFRARLTESPGRSWQYVAIGDSRPLPTTRPASMPATSPTTSPATTQAAGPLSFVQSISLKPTASGEIGSTGLTPAVYHLTAEASAGRDDDSAPLQIERDVVVPGDDIVDLGTIGAESTTRPAFAIGDLTPELKSTTLDGKPFDLAALKGKWVLLDFWGTWCGFCVAEEPTYRDAFEGWGVDGRLTMVSLAVDDTPEKVRDHVRTHDLPWTHVVLGDRAQTDVPQRFGIDGYPTVMLISPEGKLVATELRGGSLRDALIKHLGPPAPPRR